MGCFLSNETGAFSKRPPVLNIPSEMKGFKLRIGLDRGTHFLWFPDALSPTIANSIGSTSCWTALIMTLSAAITSVTVKGPKLWPFEDYPRGIAGQQWVQHFTTDDHVRTTRAPSTFTVVLR